AEVHGHEPQSRPRDALQDRQAPQRGVRRERLLRDGLRARARPRERQARRDPRDADRSARRGAPRRRSLHVRGPRDGRGDPRGHGGSRRPGALQEDDEGRASGAREALPEARPRFGRGAHGRELRHAAAQPVREARAEAPAMKRPAALAIAALLWSGGALAQDPKKPPPVSCTEHVPQGASKPTLAEAFPAKGFAGYAWNLEVIVTHGKGETVIPEGFRSSGSDAALALAAAGFALPEPDGGAGPTTTTDQTPTGAVTKL